MQSKKRQVFVSSIALVLFLCTFPCFGAEGQQPASQSPAEILAAVGVARSELDEHRYRHLNAIYEEEYWSTLSRRLSARGFAGSRGVVSLQERADSWTSQNPVLKGECEKAFEKYVWLEKHGYNIRKSAFISAEDYLSQRGFASQDADGALAQAVFSPDRDAVAAFSSAKESLRLARLLARLRGEPNPGPDNNAAKTAEQSKLKLALKPSEKAIVYVHFSPNGGIANRIVSACAKAQSEILVQAYELTSSAITDALVAARSRGVKVYVILDKNLSSESKYERLTKLVDAHISIGVDPADKAHSKTIIVDRELVITGSYNFSESAEMRNVENALFIIDEVVAEQFFNHWKQRWQLSSSLGAGAP